MDYSIFRDYNDYIIFMNGKVYSLKRNKFKKPVLNKKGYYRIGLRNDNTEKHFSLHRILAECFLKNPHNFNTIDHIDRNQQNNKINNLRFASIRLQNINKNINNNNKTGVKGITFHKTYNCYVATWCIKYKQFSKSFSVNKYGDKEAKKLAIDYRNKMFEKHYKNVI